MSHYVAPHIQNNKPVCILCYRSDCQHLRPPEPLPNHSVMYRGWEVTWDWDAAFWSSNGWRAYKGGVDLDAPHVDAGTYEDCLDAIDEEED